jgi:hypothetical protein
MLNKDVILIPCFQYRLNLWWKRPQKKEKRTNEKMRVADSREMATQDLLVAGRSNLHDKKKTFDDYLGGGGFGGGGGMGRGGMGEKQKEVDRRLIQAHQGKAYPTRALHATHF